MTGNTLACAMCRVPEGVLIWHLPRTGKWSTGAKDTRPDRAMFQTWFNRHGVACDPPAGGGRGADVLTVQLRTAGDLLLCGRCERRLNQASQGDLFDG